MVAPSKLAHVVYATHHYDQMIDWYTRVFEAKTQHANDKLTFLTYDEEHHRLAFLNLGPASEGDGRRRDPVGVHHVAYTWDTINGLMDTYERLRDMGITPVTRLRHGMTLSMYYEDPDGNRSEFQIDVLDVDAANEFMEGAAFAANPIGEDFDPDELLAAHRAGEDLTARVFRSDQESVTVPALAGD
ncbi:MAG: biphenyl 2,3-dioxygenase [Actinomycetia bacterium]|nr:biphenyl 2,3-dioxygenase [Actinomycetes bacterium]MCP3911700.1 biphenyl 2,3-dioxygenase [Actinomycetes bacterium]MCP4086969.1 biphenyl 2,3-dioxygenase [Actinomycetes bacterium]